MADRFDRISLKDMMKIPPPEMLVETILPRKTVTGLTALPGVGKSWLAMELGRAIATGTKFLGKFQAKVGNVIYVGEDSSIHDYAQQVKKLISVEHNQYEDELIKGQRDYNPLDDRFGFIVKPGMYLEDKKAVTKLINTVNSLHHSEHRELVLDPSTGHTEEKITRKFGTDYIVLDTLSSMIRLDQKDNSLMEIPIRHCRWLAEQTGACVVIIHHNSYPSEHNDGERWRGASSQIAALDNWFHILHPPRAATNKFLLKCKRFRGLRPPEFVYTLDYDETSAKLSFCDFADPEDAMTRASLIFDAKEAAIGVLNLEFASKEEITSRVEKQYGDLYPVTQIIKKILTVMNNTPDLIEKFKNSYRLKVMHNGDQDADSIRSDADDFQRD